MKTALVIGTRGSELACTQAGIVRSALLAIEPKMLIRITTITTHGDVNQRPVPLDTIGKGWFTKEIENALLSGAIDLAVHSLKDMAEDMPEGLHIGAYLPREDARDVLITKHGESLEELPQGAVIGTDSVRRQIQMRALRPDVNMQSLRGSVLTRLEKLEKENYHAIILAAAGLKRLGLENRITRYFEPHEMTPAPGQGILAVQVKGNRADLDTLLTAIHDPDATHSAHIERSFSRKLGGGCKSPTGAYASRNDDECRLIGMRGDVNMHIVREEAYAPWEKSKHLGDMLAKKLLEY
ncbi:MAG: hydroxymethylbilane synthase [Patescibacteria group bacterium]